MDEHNKYVLDEEQIKRIVDDRILSAQNKYSELDKIILNSRYHCLMFAGLATTTVSQITPRFQNTLIANKRLLIKRIQVIPYANAPLFDLLLSDGTSETVPGNMRLQRTLETYSNSLNIRFLINGATVDIFSDDPVPGTWWYPLDMDIDNIYYLYKDPVQDLLIQAATQVYTDFAGAVAPVLLNILVECYTF